LNLFRIKNLFNFSIKKIQSNNKYPLKINFNKIKLNKLNPAQIILG
jgi:hypothetical protein